MFNTKKPIVHNLVAQVIPRPEFIGTLHDDHTAQSLGYPAALVPGIDVYAYLARLVFESWGPDWLVKGRLITKSLRPVYDGDSLVVYASPVQVIDNKKTVELAVHNATGTMVASAVASLSDNANLPPELDDFPIVERTAEIPSGAPTALYEGQQFSSLSETVSDAQNILLNKEFLEPGAFYEQQGIVHPAYLQRIALRNAHSSFSHATPPIFISTDTDNFDSVKVGESIDTPGMITRLWERKGHHYMESLQLVVADGIRPIMLIRRITIYQARQSI